MFKHRATRPERIDTGDYTPAEYETFLREIAFINRYLGDGRALKKTLLRRIEKEDLKECSVLDVGSGSGELLQTIAKFMRRRDGKVKLFGIDLNPLSAAATHSGVGEFPEINAIRGDAFELPFAENTFDFAISSLFFHHLSDEQIPVVLREMSRVARRGVFVIDLYRHPLGYLGYKIFCAAFGISPLVKQDGSLSIRKGFRERELDKCFAAAGLALEYTKRIAPFRIVAAGHNGRHDNSGRSSAAG